MQTFVLRVLATLALPILIASCGKKSESSEGAASNSSTASPQATTAGAAPATPPAAGGALPSCSKTAMLDAATPKRPPLVGTVLGAKFPNGGTPKAKSPQIYSVEYFTTDTPKIEVACTIRQVLEADHWTMESMTGTGPVTMVATKAKSRLQVMVGPGTTDVTTLAIATVAP